MKKHKGQAIVEFALVLPLFLLVMFGIIYSGMLFHDYTTLSNIARASAREAALTGTLQAGQPRYTKIEEDYTPLLDKLMTSFYTASSDPIEIKPEGKNGVQTTIIMQLNVKGYFVEKILPPTFGVKYFMRKEPTS